ncbi:MAG TPA: hypothetical protein VJG90_02780 [Candidatus Nanoarchaeia archaeon]|nr:hypothetical protein [Candidatus Nanoarchaeia archaeon]
MEPHEDLLLQSQRQLEIAHHLLDESYPFVKDPKMLPAILEHIYYALDYSITALLRFERNHKRIAAYKDDFDEKYALLKKVAKRYKLKATGLDEIQVLFVKQKVTLIAFVRKEDFVMVDHKIHTLSTAKLKGFLSKTKVFIDGIHNSLRTEVLKSAQQ